jgi:hypothetical protein
MAKHFGKHSTSNAIAAVAAPRCCLLTAARTARIDVVQAIAERPERQLNVDPYQNLTSTLAANSMCRATIPTSQFLETRGSKFF